MTKRNDQYWADRNREKLEDIQKITDEEVEELIKIIKKADHDLSEQIRKMYVKYGDDNGLTYSDTLKYLRNDERKEFQKDLQYYIEKYHDSEYVKKNKRELQSLSVRARVKRIEEVQANIKMIVSELNNKMFTGSKESLKRAFDSGYLHTLHAIKGKNIDESFSMPNMDDVEELLKIPWSGKNYSDKVWNITDGFEKKLTEILNRGLIQGKHPDEIASEWRKLGMGKDGTGGTVYQCKRLMETEAHNLSAQATKKSYDENGVEKYRYLTSGHANVCEGCAELEQQTKEKAIPVKNAIAGVNYNPMHPFCHCTTVPATRYDDEDESIYDMPYDEWYKQEIEPILKAKSTDEYNDDLDVPPFMKNNKDTQKPMKPHDEDIVDEYFNLLDVRTDNQKIIDCVKKDMAIMPLADLNILKHETLVLGETTENRNIHRKPSRILRPFVKNQILISTNVDNQRGHFAHEFAHFVADKTNLYENEKFKDVIENALKGSGLILSNDEIYVTSKKFIKEYQGRTYLKIEEFKKQGHILYSDLVEYISVGYETYISNPQILYEKDKMLYDWFEQEGLYHEIRG